MPLPASWIRICATVAMLASSTALAQGGPPMFTDDPGTVERGHWEVNLAVVHREADGARDSELPLIDINYGAGERVQLKLEGGWNRSEDRAVSRYGFGDYSVGMKVRFIDDFHGWRVSTYPAVEFAHGESLHVTNVVLPLQFQRAFGEWGVNFDVGHEFREHETDAWLGGFAVGRAVRESYEWAAELHADGDGSAGRSTLAANVGLRITHWKGGVPLISIGRELHAPEGEHPAWLAYVGWQFSR